MKLRYLPCKHYDIILPGPPEDVKVKMLAGLNEDYGTTRMFRSPKGSISCTVDADNSFGIKEIYYPGRGVVKITGKGQLYAHGSGTRMIVVYTITNGHFAVLAVYAWMAFVVLVWVKGIWTMWGSLGLFQVLSSGIITALFAAFGLLGLVIYRSQITRLHKNVLALIG
jgi:hypothetical protein